jgi:hypothetical protein
MDKRHQNEKKFGRWRELPGGGRCYELSALGKHRGSAKYFMVVDEEEVTLRFWQEIYDMNGTLTGIHEKFPIDTGHHTI